MTLRSKSQADRERNDGDTAISPTELRALRRLAEPSAPATVEAHELWASRYRIIEPLGRGGMGEVFLARDVLLDRLVALKVLRSKLEDDLVDERLLLREARAAARAEHERIARVYDAGTWNDRAFIAMEYVRGETLREWLQAHRATPEEVLFILQQLSDGVRALHARGLVHRDLKPENVMVGSDGNLRILDLGIARRVPLAVPEGGSENWQGTMSIGFGVGTPGYMAPEQWQAMEVDARADLFALGVIICELVLGSAPFKGANNLVVRENTLHGQVSFDAPEWDGMPAALRDVASVALSRDREQRFASVEQMLEPLAAVMRPSIPPISGARPESARPAEQPAMVAIDSSQASAMGVSIRALPPPQPRLLSKKLARWSVLGVLAASALFGLFLRQRAAAVHSPALTPGMIRLEGAVFSMGMDSEELETACKKYPKGCPPSAQNEIPKHTVTVLPFELDEREVTNEEYARFLNVVAPSLHVAPDPEDHRDRFVRYVRRSGDEFLLYDLWVDPSVAPSTPTFAGIERGKEPVNSYHVRRGSEHLPVTQVSWLGAQLFCLSIAKRLPSEPEWEFAASGPQRRAFPWGDDAPDCDRVHLRSNDWLAVKNPDHCATGRSAAFPVLSAAQDITPDGVRDLGGNVSEWVDDERPRNPIVDSITERLNSEQATVYRGGAFDASFMSRSTARNFFAAFSVGVDIGFRCAKSVASSH
jgi:serine/threonine protein kinase